MLKEDEVLNAHTILKDAIEKRILHGADAIAAHGALSALCWLLECKDAETKGFSEYMDKLAMYLVKLASEPEQPNPPAPQQQGETLVPNINNPEHQEQAPLPVLSREKIKEMAEAIKKELPEKCGFFLVTFPTERRGYGNHVCNVSDKVLFNVLAQTLVRLQRGNDLPTPHAN